MSVLKNVKIYDLVIVGSGFGGSLLALAARRLGQSVLLLEKGRHPRFAIGESTSPMANLILEQIAERYDLPCLLPLTAWGPWRRAYPDLGCGLKRGFTYYHHEAGKPYSPGADGERALMVAGSPNTEVADTHWLRSDVDAFLVSKAIAAGTHYQDGVTLAAPAFDAVTKLTSITGRNESGEISARARLLVDATGPRGFLREAFDLQDDTWPDYPVTEALYSHFTGVGRCDSMDEFRDPDSAPAAPYPPDDAALHHVFDGGWMWVLRFGSGVTSAGLAVTSMLARDLNLADSAAAWNRFLERYPSIRLSLPRLSQFGRLSTRNVWRTDLVRQRDRDGLCCRRRRPLWTRCSVQASR
ncbi:NAD(P)/FAD-dependent oxidoreductase [Capsulimonas corticalis]|uniref:NAD(P)/FAD-dependent oxidoreductase n=1 Tax=Capsulimonas corticalis TaxID=2219043 RepID=UPI000E65CBB0|nr:NAD(P)-binding protein [Capsulimonas corticalis]